LLFPYDSFGNLTASAGSIVNPLQFTGREFDSETSLYYYRARYYDPTMGRFISEDPARINGDIDFYRYAFNAPIQFVDPFGLTSCKSGNCRGDCPDGVWESGVAIAEGGASFGPVAGGGLIFAGVFICRSNMTFNVPWVSGCGQGYVGKKMPTPKVPEPKLPVPGEPGKKGAGGFGGEGGVGGAFIRCRGYKCKEDLG
jgi:RHS repeat-associated protein